MSVPTPHRVPGRALRGALVAVALTVLALSVLAACGSDGDSAGSDGPIDVKLTEWSITPTRAEAPAGKVTFDMTNDGSVVHEFVVVKTDLAPAQLPVDDDGMFDERGKGLTFLDEVENIDPDGGTAELTVDLKPGKYLLVCNKPPVPKDNLPAHWAEKMYTSFTVTG